jgi:hypothetical protein
MATTIVSTQYPTNSFDSEVSGAPIITGTGVAVDNTKLAAVQAAAAANGVTLILWGAGATSAPSDPVQVIPAYINYAGPPTSGTFLPNQIVSDSNRAVWVASGGSPGTFTALGTGTFALRTEAATLVELVGSTKVTDGQLVGTISFHLFVAPFPLKITQISVASKAGIVASDTNYWSVQPRRYSAGAASVIAAKTTHATGGAAVQGNIDWNFDNITFANNTFAKGDILNLAFFLTGAAGGTDWQYTVCTFRYEPI